MWGGKKWHAGAQNWHFVTYYISA